MKVFPLAYTEKEISDMLLIGISKLRQSRVPPYVNIQNGNCPPFYKDGGSVRYRWMDIMEFIENKDIIGKDEFVPVKKENEKIMQHKQLQQNPPQAFTNLFNF